MTSASVYQNDLVHAKQMVAHLHKTPQIHLGGLMYAGSCVARLLEKIKHCFSSSLAGTLVQSQFYKLTFRHGWLFPGCSLPTSSCYLAMSSIVDTLSHTQGLLNPLQLLLLPLKKADLVLNYNMPASNTNYSRS